MKYAAGRLAEPLSDDGLSDGWSFSGRVWVVTLLLIAMAMAGTALARVSGLIGSEGGRASLLFSGASILQSVGAVLGVVIASILIARAPYQSGLVAFIYFLTYFNFTSAGWGLSLAEPSFVLGWQAALPNTDALGIVSLLAGLAGMTLTGAYLAWYLRFCSNFPKPLEATLFVSEAPSALGRITSFLQSRFLEHRL
jgi:hypothetical protein